MKRTLLKCATLIAVIASWTTLSATTAQAFYTVSPTDCSYASDYSYINNDGNDYSNGATVATGRFTNPVNVCVRQRQSSLYVRSAYSTGAYSYVGFDSRNNPGTAYVNSGNYNCGPVFKCKSWKGINWEGLPAGQSGPPSPWVTVYM
jgi:hypothetical protein